MRSCRQTRHVRLAAVLPLVAAPGELITEGELDGAGDVAPRGCRPITVEMTRPV